MTKAIAVGSSLVLGLLFSACGGDSTTDGGGGGGGMGGTAPAPATCSDGIKNEGESDVDCGGDCSACDDGQACGVAADCTSGVCAAGVCAAPKCGDGVKNGKEACDSKGKDTKDCNKDCTAVTCGDGVINKAAGEVCEPVKGQDLWGRCNKTTCNYGAGLDGTWAEDTGAGGASSIEPWEQLATNTGLSGDNEAGLQSFHYHGQKYLYDLTTNSRYDIAADEWTQLSEDLPYDVQYWEDGAVDSKSIWVPRDGKMHRFVLKTETWEVAADSVPDGSDQYGAAVFDGEGYVWYAGGNDELVKYDTKAATYETFSYAADFAGFDVEEARIAYDPFTEKLVVAGYGNDTFLVFDLATETFTTATPSPGGEIKDNSCQDRSGGIYIGSGNDPGKMYRYDIAADTFTVLPDLPVPHDNNASCVVSQDGYLYYATSENVDGEFFRLKLNKQ